MKPKKRNPKNVANRKNRRNWNVFLSYLCTSIFRAGVESENIKLSLARGKHISLSQWNSIC